MQMLGIISVEQAQDLFFFMTGAMTSIGGAIIGYTRFVGDRERKRYAAESAFAELREGYLQLSERQAEIQKDLVEVKCDLREIVGRLKGDGGDDREGG